MHWLKRYRKELLVGDASAGVIVALMLIPQGMAYALVAGLPPVTGLYASLLPAVAYAVFGSSMVQSVGPMAITSLMVGAAIGALAPAGSVLYGVLSQQLAPLVRVFDLSTRLQGMVQQAKLFVVDHPMAVALALGSVLLFRPRTVLRWGRRGLLVWRGWRTARTLLPGFLMKYFGCLR